MFVFVHPLLAERHSSSHIHRRWLNRQEDGLGVGCATLRGAAAWSGAWEAGHAEASAAVDVTLLTATGTASTARAATADRVDADLRNIVVWSTCNLGTGGSKPETSRTHRASWHQRDRPVGLQDHENTDISVFKLSSGPESYAWMAQALTEDDKPLPAKHFPVCVKRLLRCPNPAGANVAERRCAPRTWSDGASALLSRRKRRPLKS